MDREDLVVLGGGAMDAGLYDLQVLSELVLSYLPPVNREHLSLEKALDGNRAGVLGALIRASQSVYSNSE